MSNPLGENFIANAIVVVLHSYVSIWLKGILGTLDTLGQQDIFDQLNIFVKLYQSRCDSDEISGFHH